MDAPRKRTLLRKLPPPPAASLRWHTFGRVPWVDLVNLQSRLAYEAASRRDGGITALVCEHDPIITLGRGCSRGDVLLSDSELAENDLELHLAARGGGALLHGPGQISFYIIAPLARLQWTVGNYVRRLHQALQATLLDCGCKVLAGDNLFAFCGRSGTIATLGVGVRGGISSFGGVLNVCPEMKLYRRMHSAGTDRTSSWGSLLTELAGAARIEQVAERFFVNTTQALGCESPAITAGHPLFPVASFPSQASSPAKAVERESILGFPAVNIASPHSRAAA